MLVVDDTRLLRHVIQSNLEDDFHIIIAENGEEAVSQALHVRPDIILMDVIMPKMDGFTACEIIKENPLTHHIPIILLTAETSVEFILKSREVGAAD